MEWYLCDRNILMGVTTLPQYHLYWDKDKFIDNAGVKDTMTLKRYEKLMQYLCVSDRATEPTGQNCDKLYMIQPVLKMVQKSFKAHYNPGKNQMVDEAMIGFKGKLSYVQYLPAKPIKHGIKVWVRCNSESAYLPEFDVYLGCQQNSTHGLAYDVAMKLCQHIAGKNHHMYCDNYFTSIRLFTDLLNMKVYASGTIRQNKGGLPGEVKKPPRMNWGDHQSFQKENLVVTVWQDNKPFQVLSTNSRPDATGINQ